MYKLEILIFENGERYPILMDQDGMPHFHATLWNTVKLRSGDIAVNTIQNKLGALKWFFQWEQKNERNLYSEFQQGIFLNDKDIESIKEHLSLDISHTKISTKQSKRKKVIDINDSPKLLETVPSVGRNHKYNRMTVVADYLYFIAKLAVQHINDTELTQSINSMYTRIKAARPKGKGKNVQDKMDSIVIPDGLLDEFMAIAHFDHPKNPFMHITTRKRNHLMFLLLKELGIRRGELLSLELTHMMLTGPKQYIWVKRNHDDKYDPRKDQPVAKTKERMLRIKPETAALLDDYILNVRANIPNANKHPYLFVTHRKCPTQGQPITISTFDSIIVPALKSVDKRFSIIHPHLLRHEWNLEFSNKIDANNQLADLDPKKYKHIGSDKEAKMRMHSLGHSSEKSADVYNKRHIREKANQLMLDEQTELQRQLADAKGKESND